jgi:hypothetical protein
LWHSKINLASNLKLFIKYWRFMLGLLDTWTQLTAVQCQSCSYTFKLLLAKGSLLKFKFILWNFFHLIHSTSML